MDARLFLLLTVGLGTAKVAQAICFPEEQYTCKAAAEAYNEFCEASTTCKDVQGKGINQDGEYILFLNGSSQRQAKIFCAGMNSETPLEYLTLPAGKTQNFARYLPMKTYRPELTSFDKVRLNLTDLTIFIDDHRFATTNVPGVYHKFGSAGDCLSSCLSAYSHEGKFQVDLSGTSFRLPQSIPYEFHAFPHGAKRIFGPLMDASRSRWSGSCGGWCGKCWPKEIKLELNVQLTQGKGMEFTN